MSSMNSPIPALAAELKTRFINLSWKMPDDVDVGPILDLIDRLAAGFSSEHASASLPSQSAGTREAFEAWASRQEIPDSDGTLMYILSRRPDGNYEWPATDHAWLGFQAGTASLPSAQAVPTERAWLIEHSGVLPGIVSGSISWLHVKPKFEGYGAHEFGFTHDSLKALRFARKEDAAAVLKLHLGAAPPDWYSQPFSVTEHEWLGPDAREAAQAVPTHAPIPCGLSHATETGGAEKANDALSFDPDGDVSIDFADGKDVLSISISPTGRLAYAAMIDKRRSHAQLQMSGDTEALHTALAVFVPADAPEVARASDRYPEGAETSGLRGEAVERGPKEAPKECIASCLRETDIEHVMGLVEEYGQEMWKRPFDGAQALDPFVAIRSYLRALR